MARKKSTFSPKKKRKQYPSLLGTLRVHPKGFAFLLREDGPDIFVPKHLTLGAIDGDTVEVAVLSEDSPKGPEGEVVSISKRKRTHLAVIVTRREEGKALAFSPLLGKEKEVEVLSLQRLKKGDRIFCKVLDWNAGENLVKASVESYIGHISDPSIDVLAASFEFEIKTTFSQEAISLAESFGTEVPAEEVKKRLDVTTQEIVTIDPDTAKDFDDAISLTKDEKGHFHLGVHIADVAHYVKEGDALDIEAKSRCNSVYFPGICIPMLPEALSNALCSLKPEVIRLTESVFAEFSPQGDLIASSIAKTAICSKKRFTYKQALKILEGKEESPHKALLFRMQELALLLKQKRLERGSIEFGMTESVVRVDKEGVPLGIERVEYDITHQMIEEFMLKANEIVATNLAVEGKELIYRIHEEPSEESFQDFYQFARTLGFSLPNNPSHKDLQRLFQEAKSSPFLEQLSISFIRSLRLAEYSPENIGHYGLALENYCHFTSPIRRYTDLIVQRILTQNKEPDLEAVSLLASEKERIAMRAENSVVLLKKLRLAEQALEENPDRIYDATVTKVKPFTLFFEVSAFGMESTFHVSEIGGDFYEYFPKTMSFRGKRSGTVFSVGKKIRVQLQEIDLIFQKSTWIYSHTNPKK